MILNEHKFKEENPLTYAQWASTICFRSFESGKRHFYIAIREDKEYSSRNFIIQTCPLNTKKSSNVSRIAACKWYSRRMWNDVEYTNKSTNITKFLTVLNDFDKIFVLRRPVCLMFTKFCKVDWNFKIWHFSKEFGAIFPDIYIYYKDIYDSALFFLE